MTPPNDHSGEQLDKLKACIHCGFCLPVCPTYRITGSEAESPRGRLYLMKGLLDDTLPKEKRLSHEQVIPHLDQCLGCMACQTACPSGVEYGHLLTLTRETLNRKRGGMARWLKRLVFRHILPDHSLLLFLGFWLRLYQQSGLQAVIRKSGMFKLFPGLAYQESLLPCIPKHRPLTAGLSFGNPDGERVALMTGCVMDVFYNPVHWATIEVLAANDYYILIPEQTCCGALAHHDGEADIATDLARRNVKAMLASNPDWIVVNSAGCGSTMKEYTEILKNDPILAQKAQVFSQITIDIMALLAQTKLKPFRRELGQTVTYHAACHLHHAQRVRTEPEQVLSQIPGLTLIPLTDASMCCGSAGIYNLEHPDLSREILAEKTRHLLATGADTVVTGNPGCLLQIQKGLQDAGQAGITVKHPVELLAAAYRS